MIQKTTKKTSSHNSFRDNVFSIVQKIPEGKTLTYKQVAEKAGNPLAARAVGAVLRTNYRLDIPCHRVVRSDGGLGGYNRGIANKKRILDEEKRKSTMGA